ncbi:MAG: lysine--tRNA ligase [Alphaproteobacteria bacterium]|nr:lysine--tRNA ligase [Alphaproteobacteria bacterium]
MSATITPDIAEKCRTWAFEEAKGVVKRLRALGRGEIKTPEKGYVLFETGYGPSGLPHIGTFGEVCRTSMVMHAFKNLQPDIPVKLVCFSDDMDGLRKVPSNVPNPELLQAALGMPLSSVPNPFESDHLSYAAHNNARLCEFLDGFGFDYEFYSSTQDCYVPGRFDATLRAMLEKYEEVRAAVLPILGEDRKATYSPLMPIVQKKSADDHHPIILHNAILKNVEDLDAGVVTFEVLDDSELERSGYGTGETVTQSIFKGGCKAQWRADWALRWYALDVDYEMAGKDLVTSADIAADIVKVLGGRGPAGFRYELFLDEKGEKISKSKGNGLTMEDWLTYAPHESLAYYMFQRPTSAKKLYFDIIPKAVDEYMNFVEKLAEQEPAQQLDNPAWYIHNGNIPNSQHSPVSFALLLNLVNAANTDAPEVLWRFIQNYASEASPENAPFLDRLVGYAIRYYQDFVLPAKTYRAPDEREAKALNDLAARLEAMDAGLEAEAYMTEVFSAGKENGYDQSELREWFKAIYEVCLGQSQGPRFGSFVALYGVKDTAALIRDALDGKFAAAA